MKSDLVLLHAPSVYDFRDMAIMYGPVSDLVPSTPIFEMYPIGFTTIAEYLERHGYSVRIVNLAVKMLDSDRFDAEKFVKNIDAVAIGIDLHWLPHAHGSLEIAGLVKKHHPNTPVILGGLSSTYFHMEIMKNYPQVNYIVRGDSTEEPMLALMETIEKDGKDGKNLDKVPNLTWRENGKIHENPLTNVPDSLDHLMMDYSTVIKSAIRHGDISSVRPVRDWLRYPITGVFTVRGCTQNCVTCGGSAYSYRNFYCRSSPAFRSPENIVKDIAGIGEFTRGPIYIIGDIRQRGRRYASRLLSLLKKAKTENQLVFELFNPATEPFIREIACTADGFNISISPESHDENVRMRQGRNYATDALESTAEYALKHGVGRFDIFYMIGLPGQDYKSVLDTVEYSRKLMKKYGKDGKLHQFISPLAPFIDPGSIAYENPERHGYSISSRTFGGHRKRLLEPSWKYILNYETDWMDRSEIVDATYESALMLNILKMEHGQIGKKEARNIEMRIRTARDLMTRIDGIREQKSCAPAMMRDEIEKANAEILCAGKELEWKSGGIRLNPGRYVRCLTEILKGDK